MPKVSKLTPMQMKFAQELVYNEGRKTATECAIEAKYSSDRAAVTASELQNPKLYPLVVQYIGQLRQEILKKYDINFESHLAQLGDMRNKALNAKAWTAAINAEVARGKAAGLYVEQKIIRTGKLDDLSEEESKHNRKVYNRATEIEDKEWREFFEILKGQNYSYYQMFHDK